MMYDKAYIMQALREIITLLQNNLHHTYDVNTDLLVFFIRIAHKVSALSSTKVTDNVHTWRVINYMLYNKFRQQGFYAGNITQGGMYIYVSKRELRKGIVVDCLLKAINYAKTLNEEGSK